MKSLEKPNYLAKDTFLKCISTMNEGDSKVRLISCASLVEKATLEFEIKKTHCKLHEIQNIKVTRKTKNDFLVDGKVTVEEMKDVYTNKFVPKDSPGRSVYNIIFESPKFGVCPLCSHRGVKTLDHYLPKAHYPALSVTPSNLIPSCYECNLAKLTDISYPLTCSEEEILHPYFDNVEKEKWLIAEVKHLSPPVIVFSVKKPDNWDELLFKRTECHFRSLSLNDLYSTQASLMLSNIHHLVRKKYSEGGKNGVQFFLLENEESYRLNNQNSWQTAFFNALGNDDWFCSGGFEMLE